MLHFGIFSSRIVTQKLLLSSIPRYSSATTIVFKNNTEKPDDLSTKTPIDLKTAIISTTNVQPSGDKSTNLVAAAFASLKSDTVLSTTKSGGKLRRKTVTDDVIDNATTVDALLLIAEAPIVSRRHALKVVSKLADWSSSGKITISDFETDVRFQKLCRILGRTGSLNNKNTKVQSRTVNVGDDLSTVLGVTGDDEAAKLVSTISLAQMVKVLSALAQKRRRSTPLLRSLANNITNSNETLDLKQCADVLYAAAALTFPEVSLLERACTDLTSKLMLNKDKSAVVGSILTSIGILRYRNTAVLDLISEWIVKHHDICRPQDTFALFVTLAMVSYHPSNSTELYKVILPQLNISDTVKSTLWLDYVWSLAVLNIATEQDIATALNPEFIKRLKDENCLTIASKIKLLNIQGYANTVFDKYTGPTISDDSDITTVTVVRSREKQGLVAAMLDSLGSLLPSNTYLKSNVDTGMGFILDGECLVDGKCNPLPVSENSEKSGIKIAFMAYDYHDLCRGNRVELNGMNNLAKRLLEKKGYNVIGVSHTEFNPRDKLIRRVQYLESCLKDVVKQHSSN